MDLEHISECAAVSYGDPDHLVVIFSSMFAVPRRDFDFKDFAKSLPQTILFLRDNDVATGYHNGVCGLTESVDDTVDFLRYFIDKTKPKRVSMFGHSIGGYAAVLHGFLLGVDDIVTSGSVSFVDPATRDALNGAGERIPMAMEGVVNFYTQRGLEPKYLDLRPVIETRQEKVKAVKMYYSPEDAVDSTQTLHIAHFPNIEAVPKPGTSHRSIAVTLVREGVLTQHFATPVEELLSPQRDSAIV
jgi:pimeloyl-ACP methyl ester carboxylesterase